MIQSSLQSYVGLGNNNPFSGITSQEEMTTLLKALSAGDITGRETTDLTTASGAALKVESLDKQLKVLTYQEAAIRLWQMIPKKKAYNTVEEYNQLSSYGDTSGPGFNLEGELPEEIDSQYIRRAQLIKYLGVTKSVTHPMTLVNTHIGNIIERENRNGTLYLLKKIDEALTRGDEGIVPTEFNGIYTQHRTTPLFGGLVPYYNSQYVIDLAGAPMTEPVLESAANIIVENFGQPDKFVAPTRVISDFVKNFYGNKFFPVNGSGITDGVVGQRVQKFASQFGDIDLDYDIFMKRLPNKFAIGHATASGATSPKAPAPPSSTGAVVVAPVDPESRWDAASAGSYVYAVSALNRFGESQLFLVPGGPYAVAVDGAIEIQMSPTVSPNLATGFRIYRSQVGATGAADAIFSPLFDVSVAEAAAGTYDGNASGAGYARDRNRVRPNTDQAFMIYNSPEVWEFAQLAPLMKMDLAQLGPAMRWMILLYGTMFLYAPTKMVRFVNIG